MKISIIGIPWYRRGQYSQLRNLFTDGANLHPNYDDWRAAAERLEEQLSSSGTPAVRVEIRPDEFKAWCAERGLLPDVNARALYGNICAYEYFIDAQEELEFEAVLKPQLAKAKADFLALARTTASEASRYTVPVLSLNDDGNPDPVGTGLLVHVEGLFYLLTAAHVLDLCGNGVFLPHARFDGEALSGDFVVSGLKPGQLRSDDRVDLGFIRLTPEEVGCIGADCFLDLAHAVQRLSSGDYIACVASGYPVRDQVVDLIAGSITTASTNFITGFVDEDRYRLAKADPQLHLLITYKKQNILYNHRTRGAPPSFRGMSGGGVWLLSLEQNSREEEMPPPLAGVIVLRPNGYGACLQATRTEVALHFLRRFGQG